MSMPFISGLVFVFFVLVLFFACCHLRLLFLPSSFPLTDSPILRPTMELSAQKTHVCTMMHLYDLRKISESNLTKKRSGFICWCRLNRDVKWVVPCVQDHQLRWRRQSETVPVWSSVEQEVPKMGISSRTHTYI
jgi:hypothetical protein